MLEYYDVLKFFSSFIIVVFFIYAAYYLLKRYQNKLPLNQKGKIQIEEIRYISRDKTLVLTKIGRRNYLIAFSGNAVEKIDQWNDEDENQPNNHEFGTDTNNLRISRADTGYPKPVKQP